MRWKGRRTSKNIDDRRHTSRGASRAGVGGLGLIFIVVVGFFLGVDVTPFLTGGGQLSAPQANAPVQIDDETEEFVAVVLADTEVIWSEIFRGSGIQYTPPVLVLFAGRTQSACGRAMSATGPFYCPVDQRVYLDTSFFQVMEQRLGARGDFAKAYVIAHEVAHHVQHSLGVLDRVNRAKRQSSQADANALSVRVELQADCYSGVWARAMDQRFGVLEPGDIEEALNTAAAIGDDALQRAQQGVVVPDSFTHGTSEQRQNWFYRGYETGDPNSCDTFSTNRL
ncbi:MULTISPECIES: neutral zinc metallopeptidase [unclassified Ruegeria]|uniref:KPN_02809 family neutral zinc metallopeptidase n=1 Tax=unclassified Ruegeria TaxID=2625375 RepID=UPI0014888C38|nr:MULTISPECIES: neutral zinc metallopeptidase [unclassified Ruegeria]